MIRKLDSPRLSEGGEEIELDQLMYYRARKLSKELDMSIDELINLGLDDLIKAIITMYIEGR